MLGALIARWRKHYAPGTAYRMRAALAHILRESGIAARPPSVPRNIARGVVATPEELARLMAAPPPFLRLYMLLYFQCGLRAHEILHVTPASWNESRHSVTIRVKGGRLRTAELTAETERLIAAARPFEGRMQESVIGILHGKPITQWGLQKAFRRHADRCGVNPAVTGHDLRRTAATILYAATKDLRVAQQLLGHQRLESTLSYLAPLAPDEARRYAELLRFDHFHPKEGDKPQ